MERGKVWLYGFRALGLTQKQIPTKYLSLAGVSSLGVAALQIPPNRRPLSEVLQKRIVDFHSSVDQLAVLHVFSV
jgi:hypothetical protein